jgi:hypothetical protein
MKIAQWQGIKAVRGRMAKIAERLLAKVQTELPGMAVKDHHLKSE